MIPHSNDFKWSMVIFDKTSLGTLGFHHALGIIKGSIDLKNGMVDDHIVNTCHLIVNTYWLMIFIRPKHWLDICCLA